MGSLLPPEDVDRIRTARRGRRSTMTRPGCRLLLASLASAAALVVATASPAVAAPPEVVHTKVRVSLTHIDQCGFTVNSVVRGTDTFHIRVDRSGNVAIQDTSHIVSTLTNVANGKVVHVDSAGRDRFTPDGVVNAD